LSKPKAIKKAISNLEKEKKKIRHEMFQHLVAPLPKRGWKQLKLEKLKKLGYRLPPGLGPIKFKEEDLINPPQDQTRFIASQATKLRRDYKLPWHFIENKLMDEYTSLLPSRLEKKRKVEYIKNQIQIAKQEEVVSKSILQFLSAPPKIPVINLSTPLQKPEQ